MGDEIAGLRSLDGEEKPASADERIKPELHFGFGGFGVHTLIDARQAAVARSLLWPSSPGLQVR